MITDTILNLDGPKGLNEWDLEVFDIVDSWTKLKAHLPAKIRKQEYREMAEAAIIPNHLYPIACYAKNVRLSITQTLRNRLITYGLDTKSFSITVTDKNTYIYRVKG